MLQVHPESKRDRDRGSIVGVDDGDQGVQLQVNKGVPDCEAGSFGRQTAPPETRQKEVAELGLDVPFDLFLSQTAQSRQFLSRPLDDGPPAFVLFPDEGLRVLGILLEVLDTMAGSRGPPIFRVTLGSVQRSRMWSRSSVWGARTRTRSVWPRI